MTEPQLHTYIVTVRETVDVQYKVNVPRELTDYEIRGIENSFQFTPDFLLKRLDFTANIRESEVADVTYIGTQVPE